MSTSPVSVDPAAHPHAFASDNWSGMHPEILEAIVAANVGHAVSYGGDPWTARFQAVAHELFGPNVEAFPVLNGTGSNVLALQAVIPRWGAVICASTAHIATSETGAPEKVGGLKLLPVDAPDGKLTPELVAQRAWGWGDEHMAEPLVVSIAQATELGTVYTPDEIAALAEQAHGHGMLLHVDGSRLGNAAASLGTSLAAITSEVGADVLSLGGTKNGALAAEAVIVLRPGSAPGMKSLRKMNLQLGSKMRFFSAQLCALYEGDLWRRSADRANGMAARLAVGIEAIAAESPSSGVGIAYPVQSNTVFAVLPPEVAERARQKFQFHGWRGMEHVYRLMCSFDTGEAEVDALLAAIRG